MQYVAVDYHVVICSLYHYVVICGYTLDYVVICSCRSPRTVAAVLDVQANEVVVLYIYIYIYLSIYMYIHIHMCIYIIYI